MSLIAHYPLTGNIDDYSGNGNHGLNYGATTNSSGKIGSCYHFGTGYNRVELPLGNLKDMLNFSIAFWCKVDTTASNTVDERIITVRRASGSTAWSVTYARPSTYVSQLEFYYYDGSTVVTKTLSSFLKNQWQHIALVVQNNKLYYFIDGVDMSSQTNDIQISPVDTYGNVVIGNFGSELSRPLGGWLNDLRIYDYGLSTKEIFDLSRAKVLHYAFDDFQEPTDNILYDNQIFSPEIGGLTIGVSISSLVLNQKFRITSTTINPPYTYGSFRLYVPLSKLVNGKTYNLSCKYKIIQGTLFEMMDWCDQPIVSSTIDYGEYRFHSAYGSKTTYDNTFRFMDFYISENTIVEIWDIQLEQKSYFTPFTNQPRDGEITNLSMMGNNALLDISSTPKWVNESKIGIGSYEFFGISDYIQLGYPNSFQDFTNCTISFWRKNASTISHWLPFVGQTTSYYLMATLNGTGAFYHNNAGSPKIYKDGVYSPSATPFTDTDTWHHYVLTKVNLSAWTALRLSGYGGQWNCEGLFSDVRLYNMELSDSEILALYKNRYSLDINGNLCAVALCNNGIGSVSNNKIAYHNWEEGDYSLTNKTFVGDLPSHNMTFNYNGNFTTKILQRPNPVDVLDRMIEYRVPTTHYVQYAHPTPYYYFTFDKTKTYRYSQWIYRHAEVSSSYSSRCYLGIQGNTVCDINTTTLNSNPYFTYPTMNDSKYMDKWVLQVFYIYPYGSIGNPTRGAVYSLNGTSIADGMNFNWASSTSSHIRQYPMYEYGEITAGSYVLHYRPRLDIIDGSEPSIEDLLSCGEHLSLIGDSHKAHGIKETGVAIFRDYSEIGIMKGLAAYYPLDGDVLDYGGSNYHGTNSGATLGFGIKNMAYQFDGINNYISFPEVVSCDLIRKLGITYAAWVKLNTVKESRIIGQQISNGYSDYCSGGIGVNGIGKPIAICYDDNVAYKYVTGDTTLLVGQWYYLVVTYDINDKSLKLYVNGQKEGVDSPITTFSRLITNASNRIGLKDHASAFPTDGIIGEVRIYGRTLSPEEIAINYDIYNPTGSQLKSTKDCFYVKGQIKEGY